LEPAVPPTFKHSQPGIVKTFSFLLTGILIYLRDMLKELCDKFLGAFFGLHVIGLDKKRFLNFSVAPSIFGNHFKVLKCQIYQKISEIPGISKVDLQMRAAVLGDFLFHSRRTASKV